MSEIRTRIERHPERSVPERAREILSQGYVAHVAFIDRGEAVAMPFSYHYDAAEPGLLYVHGTPGGRAIERVASGDPVSVTVTLLDGLVYSRTALNHSMNYRSVVAFGRGARVTDPEAQQRVFQAMVARYFPNRTAPRDYSLATAAQLEATALVAIAIEESSAKAREGGPMGPLDGREDAPGTCGVVVL